MEHALRRSSSVSTPPDDQPAQQTKGVAPPVSIPVARVSLLTPRVLAPQAAAATATPNARDYASSLFKYGSLRATGGFRTSAERQGTAADMDTEMSVDDVFSVAAADRSAFARELADMRSSPHNSDSDDSFVPIPRYSHSLGSSPGTELTLSMSPDGRSPLSSSYGSRRTAVRPLSQARSYGTEPLSISAGSRHAPYAVPRRSPVTLGPLSMAAATGAPLRVARRPSWAARAPTMTPLRPQQQLYDDDETDDELGEDGNATEDEDIRPRSPSPDPLGQDLGIGGDDERDGMRGALLRVGVGARTSVPRYQFHSSSLPEARWGSMARYARKSSTDDASQVHLAAAALDRLSMAPVRDRAGAGAGLGAGAGAGAGTVEDEELGSRAAGTTNCSAFISKLWHLMSHPELYGRYIHWSEGGDVIIIKSEPHISAAFASNVLPKLFKHGNNASFVRQLNLYGFQRVPSSRMLTPAELHAAATRSSGHPRERTGGFSTASDLYGTHSAFAHPRFRRGEEAWLSSMRPRSSKKPKKSSETPS
ncbi:hypothetical protein MCUN1_000874 [Malassezia cuniculi]|uniref:HSF-type DNA-binding domain-containing protein n=1 Tax=Malassezia cuniculi TaxID=948313 RepID=A0AAF0ETF4_9BASI|nr:hypothetical protein MCUN1_000874 [Malassezia cuniculi]